MKLEIRPAEQGSDAGSKTDRTTLLAYGDGLPVGQLILEPALNAPAEGVIRLIDVDPALRGGGIGSALVSAAEAQARQAGWQVLSAIPPAATAHFWEANGFASSALGWHKSL